MFYDNFKAACKRKGTNMTVVLSELGYSTSSTGSWKAGSFPRLDIAINIANHLEISLDELVYGINNAPSRTRKNEQVIDQEWIDIISHIPPERQQICKDFLRTHMIEK
nr:hypothetical protein [uncultured Anaerobutyricum sp.]